jgi:hypothetical protein
MEMEEATMAVWVGGVLWCSGQWSFPSSVPLIVYFFFPDASSFEWFFFWFYIFERLIALLVREHARDGK